MIFVDTSFWFGLRARRDSRHPGAVALWRGLAGDERLVTTSPVLGEAWTLVRRRSGHSPAVALLDAVQRSPRVQLVHPSAEEEDEAWAWLRRHDERPYFFVDATSFAVMRTLEIAEALAFDGDFTAAGFVERRAA